MSTSSTELSRFALGRAAKHSKLLFPRRNCHGLRRYAVTDILRRSDVGLARVFAGHADCSTTIRSYDTRGLDDLEKVVRQGGLRPSELGGLLGLAG